MKFKKILQLIALLLFTLLNNIFITVASEKNFNDSINQNCNFKVLSEIADVNCFGENNGYIDLTIVGASNPKIIWSNGKTSEDLYDISAGEYKVVIEENNCKTEKTYNIIEPSLAVKATINNLTNISCPGLSDGSFSVNASGGTEPYEFSIDGGINFSSNDFYDLLPAGDFSIIIKDRNNCETTLEVSISEPDPISVNIGENLTIYSEDEIILDAGNGYDEYLWNNGETGSKITFSKKVESEITESVYVDVVDENGCPGTSNTINITIKPVENIEE